jgi:subfamily B ATP-binding cassette protein MsbA
MLLRFYDPDQGRVLMDGIDIRTVTQDSLRENIGIVSQDTFLFHDTIRENIRYGRLNATEEEIVAAAKKSHAHDFIMAQSKGYDTVVGDAGCNLSGGQKQRLSIARAVLRNAPILLLDEATSALDTETERIIQDAIHQLSEGKTVIAIAHRLSTIMEADQIVVMREGRIQAVGTHAELLATNELYQNLNALQFKET